MDYSSSLTKSKTQDYVALKERMTFFNINNSLPLYVLNVQPLSLCQETNI